MNLLSYRRSSAFICGSFLCVALSAHEPISTKLTWTREVSRIIYKRCASCHHEGGRSMSLMTYDEARPWAKAIQEEVLERRMPPWGAVKGFGEFSNDQALTQEEISVIADWVEGGAPKGEDQYLPPAPRSLSAPRTVRPAGMPLTVSGVLVLRRDVVLRAIQPAKVPDGASLQLTAELPDGEIEPLLWLRDYKVKFPQVFTLQRPLRLPKGTRLAVSPPGAGLLALTVGSTATPSPAR